MKRPNILLFLTDDQRHDTIAALGHGAVRTPNLDRLAEAGACFTRAHIPGGTVPAVCMPSRAMLHTGRGLFRLDRDGRELPPAHATLGETLQRAGYATFATGKWHNGRAGFARSFSDGDEIFFGGMADHWNVPAYRYDPSGRYGERLPAVADPFRGNRLELRGGDHVTPGRHSTDLFVESARGFLRRAPADRPFFLYVSLLAPHDPRTMPAAWRDLYDPARVELPPNFMAQHPFDTGALEVRDELLAARPRDPAEIRRHLAEYYAMISHLDDGLGRLLGELEAAGRAGDTIVLVTGDNGLALGQHGLMGKQNLYDHSLRVPLILRGPGIPRGARREAPVWLSDLFPTLCDLAGVETPASVEGRSLVPCLGDPSARVRDSLYLAYADSIRGLRAGRHKLIEYACGATQLFDLEADPFETCNLAGPARCARRLARMRRMLAAEAAAQGDREHPLGVRFWAARADLAAPGSPDGFKKPC